MNWHSMMDRLKRIISYLLTKKEKKGKEKGKKGEKSFLLCLYNSAINIQKYTCVYAW
jgi:hypothetical protein